MSRLRVGIGAAVGGTGGPLRYAQDLVVALVRAGDAEICVLTNRPEAFAHTGARIRRVPLPSAALEPLWDHVLLPTAARAERLDVYHGVKGALPLYLGCRQVVTIHDLAVYSCPETFDLLQHLHMRPHLRLCAWRADHILADSEHARADIVARLRVPPARVTAVPLGVRSDLFRAEPAADETEIAARLELPERFFLYAGTVQPRKNVDRVLRAHAELGGEEPLLIAGRRRPGYRPSWWSEPPRGVRILGAVSDSELAVLYRRAVALVSPSSYEGFGLTLLEAMACGCPVIAGANTSVPEVVGGCGILLDDLSVPSIRDAMLRLRDDAGLRADLRRRGIERARQLTWDAAARRTLAVYEEVARG